MSRLRFAVLLIPFVLSLHGCGGSKGTTFGASPPASLSFDRFRPNYGGDLSGTNYYPGTVIRYRIVTSGARNIQREPLAVVVPSATQRQDIVDGFAKWQSALSRNPAPYTREIREAGTGEYAEIDVVVQDDSEFKKHDVLEVYGDTNLWLKDSKKGYLGRSVIRLRKSLAERVFRYTALHEIGHSLGMWGHSKRVISRMYPLTLPFPPLVELDQTDENTIRALYTRD